MLQYLLFLLQKSSFALLSNLIPIKSYRKKARDYLFAKTERLVGINEVDSYIPQDVLNKINSVDNDFFINENMNENMAKTTSGGGIMSI